MLIYFVIVVIILIIVILLFSSPKLSPIPYFPSQKVDLPKIIKALSLKNNQTVFDLGAGDGVVVFKAAEKAFQKGLNTQFVAVEINPVLLLILNIRRLFHPNRKNIKIIHDNIFKINIKKIVIPSEVEESYKKIPPRTSFGRDGNIVIYLYISPWYLEKTISNIKNQISRFKVVSYMYPIKSSRTAFAKGKNSIFIYDF